MSLKKLITAILHLLLVISIFYFSGAIYGLIVSNLLYLIVFRIIPRQHYLGVYNLKMSKLEESEKHFDKSITFLKKHRLIDKYGFLFLLNFSHFSYLESSLYNKAAILTTKGNIQEAKSIYKEVIALNPKNKVAKEKLDFLNQKRKNVDNQNVDYFDNSNDRE